MEIKSSVRRQCHLSRTERPIGGAYTEDKSLPYVRANHADLSDRTGGWCCCVELRRPEYVTYARDGLLTVTAAQDASRPARTSKPCWSSSHHRAPRVTQWRVTRCNARFIGASCDASRGWGNETGFTDTIKSENIFRFRPVHKFKSLSRHG